MILKRPFFVENPFLPADEFVFIVPLHCTAVVQNEIHPENVDVNSFVALPMLVSACAFLNLKITPYKSGTTRRKDLN